MNAAFQTALPEHLPLAASPQLAENSRLGFRPVASTSRWGFSFSISSYTLGLSGSLYDGRVGSCSTGKERDTESGNDYFGARYYASTMGRFLSPDWSAKIEPVPYSKLDDPQSLNLYAYVRNNPLSRVDLDGHSDYWWQKVKNWASGNGFRTNAQVQGLSIAQTALTHTGSKDWAINGVNTSGGHVFKPGSNKCNEFVADTLGEAGKKVPTVPDGNGGTRLPTAHELADHNVHIDGLSDPKPVSEAQRGDVIAQAHGDSEGHTGIIVGPGQTASANANEGGTITVNDWGFRSSTANPNNGERNGANSPAPVVRTPDYAPSIP